MSRLHPRKSTIATTSARYSPELSTRFKPQPHTDDTTVRTYDFAYLAGQAESALSSRAFASLKTILAPLISQPLLLQTLTLIFGGCCSNVYTLEWILSLSSSTGTLITCLQFLFITLYNLPSQLTFTVTSPPEPPPLSPTTPVWLPRLKARRVPLKKWMIFAAQFVLINVLNNAAFGYEISLPLHIILRSAGPVASMCVGYLGMGRRYSRRKMFSVVLLFMGVVLAALSDAGSKPAPPPVPASIGVHKTEIGKSIKTTFSTNETGFANDGGGIGGSEAATATSALLEQAPGFALLTLALILSSAMGIWSDNLYTTYGRNSAIAQEQLFYGHLLSLPFFMVQYRTLNSQFSKLLAVASLELAEPSRIPGGGGLGLVDILLSLRPHLGPSPHSLKSYTTAQQRLLDSLVSMLRAPGTAATLQALTLLALNSLTQIICISGVHHLSTQTSALTVSIVLNIRKVVSLLLSIWLFGNALSMGILVGAGLVFVGGGIYGLPDGKVGEGAERERRMNGVMRRERERARMGEVNEEGKKDQ